MTNAQSAPLTGHKYGGQLPRAPQRFSKSNRLLRSRDFRKVYDGGSRFSCAYFVAFILPRPAPAEEPAVGAAPPEPGVRIGFTLPRAVGKAVVRNRIRRRLREILRPRLAEIDPSLDLVINPRRKAYEATVEELTKDVERLVTRCLG